MYYIYIYINIYIYNPCGPPALPAARPLHVLRSQNAHCASKAAGVGTARRRRKG